MKAGIFCLLFYVILNQAFSQANFRTGLIVKNNGDTVRGFIDQKEWFRNPISFTFKRVKEDKGELRYDIDSVRYFEVNEAQQYHRCICQVSTDPVELLQVSEQMDRSRVTGTIFLKLLTGGKYLDLFIYRDKIKMRFYMSKRGDLNPQELIYQVQRVGTSVASFNRFRDQLMAAAEGSGRSTESLKKKISKAGYFETDLTKIVEEINGKEPELTKSTEKDKESSRSGFFAGVDLVGGGVQYSGNLYLAQNEKTSFRFLPFPVAGYDLWVNPQVGKIVIRGEITMGIARFHTYADDRDPTYGAERRSQSVTQPTAAISGQFLYYFFRTDKLRLFAGVGLRLNYGKTTYNLYTYASNNNGYKTEGYAEDFPIFGEHTWYSIPFRFGAVLNKKWEISFGYITKAPVTHYYGFVGDVYYWQGGVKYFFRKQGLR